jgi:Polyketide synthase dehydratase
MKQLANQNNETLATGFRLRDVEISQALVVPDTADGIELQTVLSPVSTKEIGIRGWKNFAVSSVNADSRWTQHAEGVSLQVL